MAPHIKNERARLENKRDKALKVFESELPEAYEEFVSAEAGLAKLSTPAELRYAKIKGDKNAIAECLKYEKKWLPKRMIVKLLGDGGYPMPTTRGRDLVVQNITKNVGRKNFQEVDGTIGLPSWKWPETKMK